MYPNPAINYVSISGLKNKGKIRVLALNGTLLDEVRVTSQTMLYNTSSLRNGTYVLQYLDGTTVTNIKFVKAE